MQDRTIDNALLALRKRIIRGKGDGLELVEALCHMRGIRLPRVLPPHRERMARAWEIRGIILQALDRGPLRVSEIERTISLARGEEYGGNRTSQCLYKMKMAGLVRREGQLWNRQSKPTQNASISDF